jgi:branched-chain amino acid transport system ATP-binding protein
MRVGLADRAQTEASVLAHGERRQLETAMALVVGPKLLLDEPRAGMSSRESENVVTLLRSLKGRYSVLLAQHDMDAVFGLADRITVLVYGRVIAIGTVAEIRENREVRRAYLGEEDAAA